MFVGRERELEVLNRLYDSGSFEMPVIYGRRRVGKTRLISEFVKDKRAIYVQARRTNAEANLALVSDAITAFAAGAPMGSFGSFDEAIDALARLSRDERLVFVIDEYPYLAYSFPEISSLLQDKIDHMLKDGAKLMLVLCGSSLSFMEEQVLGYESPLYGRRTAQLKVEPFDFFTTLSCWPGMNPEDAAVLYGCTGGIPAYVEKIDPRDSVRDSIKKLLLSPDGYLFEEPGNLLLQECRSPEQYDAIIQAIASGKSRLNEIATTAKIPESNTRTYLRKLESLGIVKREAPFKEASSRKSIYALADSMFRFWYRFVPRYMSLIANGMADVVYERMEPHIADFMGGVFEGVCMQYLYAQAKAGRCDVLPVNMGRWWGNDNRTKSQEEIDIVVDDDEGNALFAECKWRNEPTGADVAEKLVFRSELFRYGTKRYVLFSKSGFTSGCREYAAQRGDMGLLTFNEMCESLR